MLGCICGGTLEAIASCLALAIGSATAFVWSLVSDFIRVKKLKERENERCKQCGAQESAE